MEDKRYFVSNSESRKNKSRRNQIYENVDLFKGPEDPFGDDFEAALKQGVQIRGSFSSFDCVSEAATPPLSATPTKSGLPCPPGHPGLVYTPPVPAKKCTRSVSQLSRLSIDSGGSDLTQPPRQSYDEVSICSNFSKPVIHTPPTEKVYDVFSNISFSSPLHTLDSSTSSPFLLLDCSPRQTLEFVGYNGRAQERNMNSLESNISSLNICEKTIDDFASVSESDNDDPYENIEEIRQRISENPLKLPNSNPPTVGPDPPPRNQALKPAAGKTEADRPDVTENVYSECSSFVSDTRNFREKDTLFDRLINETSPSQSQTFRALGAIPKSSRTIDIRTTVHKWYEEAVEEVQRDLSLDIQHLEKSVASKPGRPRKPSYEHVCLAVTGRMDGEDILPKPTAAILRDFDPCYSDTEEETTEDTTEEGSESEVDEEGIGPVSAAATAAAAAPCDIVADVLPGADSSTTGQPSKLVMPKKFPVSSPKKINFGPPKPPRFFDYSSLTEDPKKDLRLKSPKELLLNKPRKVERSAAVTAVAVDNLALDELKADNTCDSRTREENLYAAVAPSRPENIYSDLATPYSDPAQAYSDPATQLQSSPPPLPVSLPPTGFKPRQTMYENVWIERSSPVLQQKDGLPAIPERTLPAFTEKRPTRPPRPEGQGPEGRFHQKSDSIDSQSSVATTDSNHSKDTPDTVDNVESTPVQEKKGKKFTTGRSFSVTSIKLGKLPGIADNIKRRMSDQLKPINQGVKGAPIVHTPDDTDDDELSVSATSCDTNTVVPNSRKTSVLFLDTKSGSRSHAAAVYVLSRRKKQFFCKWCVLGSGLIKWFNDTSVARPKVDIMLSNVFTITKKAEKYLGPDQQDLYCWDIAAINSKGKFVVYIMGCPSAGEREVWMERIVQSLGTRLQNFSIVGCRRIGWAYLKAGFAAEWSLAWIYLADRHIVYATQDSLDFEKIDLKKTKDVFVRKDSKNLCLPLGFTKHPVLVCDFNDRSLYILLGVVDEVAVWRSHIEEIAFTNNNALADQQVTHENVPVIVDKCVKFVFSHGVMTEGIYRHAGVNTKINKLLSEFRSNAWAVQISRENYSEHDVANVLKRYVRQLEEPLLTHYLRDSFMKTTDIQETDTKLRRYKNLLKQLPGLNYSTMRKLLGHLHTVAEQCDKNRMPVYNLAPLWGPNMLIVDTQEQGFEDTSKETEVCADLITNYPYLFDVDMEELDKEKKLLDVLEKINYPTPSTVKRSGDVRMWCYIESRTAGKCVSISLHPSLTAGEAILLVSKEAQLNDIQGLLIHEIVLGETLERPVHYSEKMLDLTLRWGFWDDEDRLNNYLVLKQNKLYADAVPCAVPPLSIFSEIQFSDNKPKSKFSKFLFSVSNASITCYKEEKNGQTSESSAWPVEDIIWYIGCERKRNPPHSLNLTFISKTDGVRSKEAPQFGRVLSFSSRELFTKWMAALLVAEYGTNIVQNNLVLLD